MKFDTQMRLAANLKQLRVSQGFSQAQLAGRLQVNRSVLALYESGQRCPDPETLYEIAHIYGLRMETLLETSPEIILSIASCAGLCEAGEAELVKLFRRLSPFSKGRLLEKAEDLAAWDAAFAEHAD